MADEIDIANDRAEEERARNIKNIQAKANVVLYDGYCMDCGHWSSTIRLGTSLCTPCRSRDEARRGIR